VAALGRQRQEYMPGVASAAGTQRAEVKASELELGFEAAMRGSRAIKSRGDEIIARTVCAAGAFDETDEFGRLVGPGWHLGAQ
jgi:hypothetical protein